MTATTIKLTPAAMRRAADWLEANPDKHIAGHLADDKHRRPVPSPFDPRAACFCAYGRYMLELGEPARIAYAHETPEAKNLGVYQFMLQSYGVDFQAVYSRNDRKDFINPAGGSPKVIPYLRNLADQIEKNAR